MYADEVDNKDFGSSAESLLPQEGVEETQAELQDAEL
jgi:hypothetical protein